MLIHADSLHTVNWFSREYAMVQIPVLPPATPLHEWAHGLYCDEFAEYQMKGIPVRQRLDGFLPANGVGTGLRARRLSGWQWRAAESLSIRSVARKTTRLGSRCMR
jgi:hypothetical protein